MANPFDQFDAPASASNPFDQFDEAPKPAGMIRKIADKGLGFASGAVGATKAIADAAGAGNRVSGALGAANEFLNDNLSPQAKADQQEQSAIMDAAKGQGVWEGVKAGAKAFGVAPVQTAVQGLGSVVPVLAGGLAGLPGAAATGIAMGAGTAKGAIYDRIKKEGGTDEAANQAQSYSGPNTDQIAMGGALGVADALTGVSRIAGGMVRGALGKPVAQAATTGAERGVIGRMGMGVVGEMPLEAAQGGQEQVAANLAAQRAGYQAGTWDNVASNATLEALASAGPGAAFGAFDKKSALPVPLVPPVEPAQTLEQVPPLQLGNTPDPMVSFADGTVGRQSEVDKYINGLPPDQQPAARAKLMGMAPQPAKPSESMGLTPTAAPSLTNAAILAVDSGASQPQIEAADPVQAAQDDYRTQTAALLQQQDEQAYEAYMTAIEQASVAQDEAPGETITAVVPIANVLGDYDNLSDDEFFAALGATPEETQDAIANQPSSPQASVANPAVTAPDVTASAGEGAPAADAKQTNLERIRAASRKQPTALGTQTNAVAGPGFGVNDVVQKQPQAQEEQAPVATNDVANQPWSMTKDTFDSWPRAMQWGFARQQGIKPQTRNRDAEQEKNSHILSTTPGGRGGDKAPDTFYSDIRNLHKEIIEKALAEGRTVPAEVLADYPDLQNSSANKVGRKDSAQLAQPESVVLPTQNATNNTPAAPTGAPMGVTSIDQAAHAAATSPLNALPQPTDGQKKAGNYAKGHVMLGGLDLSIENPAGSVRSGKDKTGKPWSNTLQHHYGYIKGTMGNDKDHVDVFVSPKTPPDYSGQVFVIDQVHPETGRFDEHKVMVGFPNILAAKAAYMSNYAKGWKGMKAVTPMAFNDFKSWVKAGPKNVPLAQDKSVSKPTEKPSAQATKTQQVQAERPPQGTTAATTDKPAADAGVAAAGKEGVGQGDGINDNIRALRAKSFKTVKQGGPRGDVRLSTDPSLYVPFEAAVAEARKAVANGVKPVPFQIHDALDIGIGETDRVIAALNAPVAPIVTPQLPPAAQQKQVTDEVKRFYVTMIRGSQVARLAGPFDTKEQAEAMVGRAREEANKADPRSAFDAFGVSGVTEKEPKPGVLNKQLGIGKEAAPATEKAAYTQADADAARKQVLTQIEAAIDGMKGGVVQTKAAAFLPSMGIKTPIGKARIKTALADQKVNMMAAASEFGVALQKSIVDVLEAQIEGKIQPLRETITPADDTNIGVNVDGNQLYQRKDGSVYQMRDGRPSFSGFLEPISKAEPTEITHNGTRIYKTKVKLDGEIVDKWSVQSQDNKHKAAAGERTIGGDSLHDTLDAAKKAADFEAKQEAQAQARKAESDAQEKEAQAKKDANKGKSIVERRKESVLDSATKLPPQAGLGAGTKRESMQKAVDQERAIKEVQVDDTAAKKRDQDAVDLVRIRGYILGLSNENIPVVKAGLEAQARLKANDYKKPEYRVYAGRDTNGSFYEITKTEYDYAQELKAQPAEPPVSKTETTELDKKSTHFWKGETFRDIGPMVIASPDVYVRKEPKFTGSNLLEAPKEFDYFLTDGRRNQKISKDVADYIASLKIAKAEQPAQLAAQEPIKAGDNILSIPMTGRGIGSDAMSTLDLGKPVWEATDDDLVKAVQDSGTYLGKPGSKYDPYREWREGHAKAIDQAVKDGRKLTDEVLYDKPQLIRTDLSDDDVDIAVDAMVDVYRATKDYGKAVQAYRDFGKAQPAAQEPARPEGDTKFSRKAQAPADIKNLVTLHNLNADNLLYSNSIGGIPAPSIGITKVDSAFGGFGDITLIAPKGMIDPANGTPVYDRDAYTARYPTLNYKKVKAAKADAFYDRIVKVRELGFDGGFVTQVWDAIKNASTQNPDKVWNIFQGNDAPRLLYASEVLGKSVKIPTRNVPVDFPWVADKQFAKTLEKLQQALNDYPSMEVEASPEMAELSKAARAAIERLADKQGPWDDPVLRDDFMEAMAVSWGNSGAWVLKPDAVMPWKTLDRVFNSARNVGKTEVDKTELSKRLDKLVKSSDEAYANWALGMIKPLFEPPTITLRGKEVEPTLQNVVEAMTTGATAGAEKTMTSGPGKISALLGKRFKSLAQIQAARDQVVSEAAETEAKKSTDAILDAYRTRALSFYTEKDWRGQVDTWGAMDASMEALAAAGKMGTGDGAIRMALARKGFKSVDQTTVDLARQSIDAIRSTATNYFEAKPQRAVKLNEFRAAVVPKGTSKEVLDVLAANGIQVATYNKADPEAKNKALEKLARKVDKEHGDVLFSRGTIPAGLPIRQVTAIVRAITERWGNAPQIIVATNMADPQIPQAVRDYDQKQKSMGATGEPEGFIHGGKVYLLAEQLATPTDVMRVLFHEALGHAGLRGVFGKELHNILNQIVTMRRADVIKKARQYGLVRTDANGDPVVDVETATDKEVFAAMDQDHKLHAAEEVLAEMAQTRPEIGFVTRAVSLIRAWLRKHVPGFSNLALTDNDIIAQFLIPARRFIEGRGAEKQQGAAGQLAFGRGGKARLTDTPAFNAWFGNSKVVDADGKPLVVYHGTARGGFAEFSISKTGSRDQSPGAWFSDSELVASTYSGWDRRDSDSAIKLQQEYGLRSKAIYKSYLSIQNPLVVNYKGADAQGFDKDGNDVLPRVDAWVEEAIVNGHDGLIVKRVVDRGPYRTGELSRKDGTSTLYVVFSPTQIKSATGNNGNFDGTNPDIRFSRGTNESMTNKDVVGNQGGRSADDNSPGAAKQAPSSFANTKVVDKDGAPKVVYHTTNSVFDRFDFGKLGSVTDENTGGDQSAVATSKLGFWFHERELTKPNEMGSSIAMPVYLNLETPVTTITHRDLWRIAENFDNDSDAMREYIQSGEYDGEEHDGIILKDAEFGGYSYIAFDPDQIHIIKPNESTAPDSGNDTSNPDIRFSIADTLNGAANNVRNGLNKATVTDLKHKFGNRLTDFRGLGLQTLGRRQLVDLYAGDLPQMESYSRMVAQMDADKNESGAEADALATDWGKLKDERQLAELMHDATLAQIDPDKAFVEGDNRDFYDALKHGFDRLTPEAKAAYRKARDMYSEHNDKVRDAIRERIMRSEMSSAKKQALLTKMEGEFFKKVKGVYFPLARFGQYVTIVKSSSGDVISANRSETMNEAEATRKILLTKFPPARGFKVSKVLKDKEFNAARDGVGRGFMADLFETLDKTNAGEELTDAISQLYLAALPDLSWAKHGIHRKGTPGFSQDARRAFAQNMFHGARYLAKLRYADRLQTNLDDMQEHIASKADDDGFDSVKAQQVVDEMVKRHDTMMNPQTNPISTALTSFGFVFHLGLSPASALVNLSQTALVAYPVMGAKWGFGKASAALMSASQQAASNKNDISKALNGDELEAYNEAVRAGVIDVTMAHDLAGIAQGEDSKVSAKIRPVMKAASFLFHHAEKFNRQVTFVASYRLARETGAGFQAAYDQAVKATYDGHFDYSASNRPRVMQGNVAKVVLLFKQYAQNMIYTLTRQAQLSLNAATPAERAEARKALGGLLVSHALAAGALGLPMVGMLLSAASAIGGDDDEPWDAKVALQNMLADTLGKKPAEVFAHGLSRLTPWDISGRVGLDKLLLPDVQEGLEGADAVKNWMAAALGPVAGIAVNAGKGMQDMANGQYARGLESMLPSALRSPLKAYRYGTEGNIDKSGVAINDEIGAAGVAGQALGFSPSEARLAQEGKSAIYSADRAIQARRSSLTRQFALAAMAKDQDGMTDARKDIARFNEKNPKARITPINLMQSVRARRKRIEQAEQGVYLPKKRQDAIEAGRFALAE